MPRRRPPLDGHVVNNFLRFAAVIFFIPWLVEAQQQQRQPVRQRHDSPHEGLEQVHSASTRDVTKVAHSAASLETGLGYERRKNTFVANKDKNDASAIATLAPAESAVAAPTTRRTSVTSGLTSPHIARSLGDWEVEDFVLLATVDGKLHARDRKTGKHRWELINEQPMVSTQYHRKSSDLSKESTIMDNYLWIIEPTSDGALYLYKPDGPSPGLVNTGLTMKKLVELSPYADGDNPATAIHYTGEKKTNLITVDANTGKVLSWFGTVGAMTQPSCNLDDPEERTDSGECPKVATLTLGRNEYIVGIHAQSGKQLATLSFSEWSVNNYDHDLQHQYNKRSKTLDNKYVFTAHDGGIIGLDHASNSLEEPGLLFNHKFSSPVVRVFDVARPWRADKDAANLIVLPQPLPPTHEDRELAHVRENSIFLNHTNDGSWFAMSGKSYPLAVRGIKAAQCTRENWAIAHPQWDLTNNDQLSEALVGLHSIDGERRDTNQPKFLTISAPDENETTTELDKYDVSTEVEDPTILDQLQEVPGRFIDYVLQFVKNPVLFILIAALLIRYQREARSWIGKHAGWRFKDSPFLAIKPEVDIKVSPEVEVLPEIPVDKVVDIPGVDGAADATPTKVEELVVAKSEVTEKEAETVKDNSSEGEKASPSAETPAKKKAHRGRRGGVKHKKGRTASQDDSLDGKPSKKSEPTVEDAVREAQKVQPVTKLEPDIRTVATDPQEVSGPIIRIGALEVNTEKLIGTGSNGTMVFEGKFDGREVAVKRMLIQFFDIASQETKLLRESDDHPNVIRYFAQQQAAGFLYIALELCPASLADVIDKPYNHRELAQAGERNLPNVLYQITNGLHHLHKLRIVHRDLKPQNILVSMGKDGKPRLLVSDFGLCKKLEGEQSSFRATTAHAAGTSGWRAPELLLDDDAKDGHQAVVDASTDGNSGSIVLGAELPGNRRATRAIDIFSLGLVFFYVLTKGSHPFDCGDRFMREVNIRKGKYNLGALEVLGDYAFEAQDLIGSMLAAEPRQRPQAHQVMAHPFFWSPKKRLNFLCDVSDHFEKEKRDPPSDALRELESYAPSVCGGDFLKYLGKEFVDSMGKQRKYTGTRLLDLLRALRNKKNHYEDMSDKLKKDVGPLPEGYLCFWTTKFPNLLISCWNVVFDVQWDDTDRFREYFLPAGL